MKRYVLSLHAGHNSAAAIGDETGLLYAIQEERLTGEKNFWGFPRRSLQWCMDQVGASPSDLISIAYGGKQVLSRYHSRADILNGYKRAMTNYGKLRQRVAMPIVLRLSPEMNQNVVRRDLASMGLGDVPIVHYDHHFTHAATAYYGLRGDPNEKKLLLTCDGDGDNMCASVRVFGGGEVQTLAETNWANSLGAIYSWVTYMTGFVPLEHEYKLMGMAPYASDKAAEEMAQIFHAYVGLSKDGLRFEKKTRQRTNDLSDRLQADLNGKRFDHVCAGLQKFIEDILCEWARNAVRASGVRNVLASGGVFMNVKANKRIAELPEVDSFEAFPSCGDETLPMGALWVELAKHFGDANVPPLKHFYLGGDLDREDTEASVKASGFKYEKPEHMPTLVAELLASGVPVARCAGRMEFGARALGNRSILADPKNQDVVRVINQMVKKRDFWMPFAPMAKRSRQEPYFKNPKDLRSPYMMMTFDTKDNFKDFIAAVHNADLTCRAQLVEDGQNPEMEAILEAFEAKTGRSVVLNTSFNLHGFPIVRDAEEAIHVFKNSGLTRMQVGEFMLMKD
ncbi:MAG: hypothetical protein IPK60_02950 [Sandaracinaceae bacterium]|nr:hypothetical protein [Sandaracinaceae bacterium]